MLKAKKSSLAKTMRSYRAKGESGTSKISDILMHRLRRTLGNTAYSPPKGILSEEGSSVLSPTANLVSDRFES